MITPTQGRGEFDNQGSTLGMGTRISESLRLCIQTSRVGRLAWQKNVKTVASSPAEYKCLTVS